MEWNVITATLSLVLSIDCMICFALNFILEKNVKEVYGLPLTEIAAKWIEMRLTIDPSAHQCPDQHPVTARRIWHHC